MSTLQLVGVTVSQGSGELKQSKTPLHFSELSHCNICDMKGGQGNKSNPRKHLVKRKINLKAEERTVYDSSPAAATANVSTASGKKKKKKMLKPRCLTRGFNIFWQFISWLDKLLLEINILVALKIGLTFHNWNYIVNVNRTQLCGNTSV